jgi:hypothetical protein
MNKVKVQRLEFDRDMWKLRYVALCEMTAQILNMKDEEVNEIINSQIQDCVEENNLFGEGKLNG